MSVKSFVLRKSKVSSLASGAATLSFDAHVRDCVPFVVNGPEMDKRALQSDYRNATRKLRVVAYNFRAKERALLDG